MCVLISLCNRSARTRALISLVPRPHTSSREEKGSGVTSRNAWASSRNEKRPMKSQSGVYWNNAEARTSTSIVPLKVML